MKQRRYNSLHVTRVYEPIDLGKVSHIIVTLTSDDEYVQARGYTSLVQARKHLNGSRILGFQQVDDVLCTRKQFTQIFGTFSIKGRNTIALSD